MGTQRNIRGILSLLPSVPFSLLPKSLLVHSRLLDDFFFLFSIRLLVLLLFFLFFFLFFSAFFIFSAFVFEFFLFLFIPVPVNHIKNFLQATFLLVCCTLATFFFLFSLYLLLL